MARAALVSHLDALLERKLLHTDDLIVSITEIAWKS